MFGRRQRGAAADAAAAAGGSDSDVTIAGADPAPSHALVKQATRTRLIWALISAFFLLISVVFLILVEIGDTSVNSTLNDIYFINLNISQIVPVSVPNSALLNSVITDVGLHDFYTVGLWNFCEGYNNVGITYCSPSRTMYWFNPIETISSELLIGVVIDLPARVNSILDLIHYASNWMFGLFLAGVCLNFVMMFLTPLSVYSRWATLPIMVFTFLGALLVTAAAVVATVMFIIMGDAFNDIEELNIKASIGTQMFAFMWIAAGAAIISWLIQLCLTCCCASRRDVASGRKWGSRRAWRKAGAEPGEKAAAS